MRWTMLTGNKETGQWVRLIAKMVQTNNAIAFEKHYNAGEFDDMTKADWHALIEDGAEQSRAAGETREQAYTKFITSDSLGRELFRVYQNCSKRALYKSVFGKAAPVIEGDARQDYVPPAEAEMRSMASRHHAANPHKTYEQSYVSVFTDPKNRSLSERIKSEGIVAAQARMHG